MLKVKCIPVGLIGTNCYVVYREDSREAVILDPGAEEERILSFLTEESLKPRAILLTHGHYDHILAVPALLRKYGIPLYAAEAERELLSNGKYNMSGTEPEDAVEIRDFLPLKCLRHRGTREALSASLSTGIPPISLVEIPFFMSPTGGQTCTAGVRRPS